MFDWLTGPLLGLGSAAPDFSLSDETGKVWSLRGLRGRHVLLVFYPGDSTPGCTKQLCEIRDHSELLRRHQVQMLGINPQGASSHGRFRERFQLPFPLLVDERGRVSSRYGCGSLIVRRTVYLIGKDGRILFAKRGMPSSESVLREAGVS